MNQRKEEKEEEEKEAEAEAEGEKAVLEVEREAVRAVGEANSWREERSITRTRNLACRSDRRIGLLESLDLLILIKLLVLLLEFQ